MSILICFPQIGSWSLTCCTGKKTTQGARGCWIFASRCCCLLSSARSLHVRLGFGTLSSGLHFCTYPFWLLLVWALGEFWPSVWDWAEWSKSDCFWLLVMCDTTSAIHGVVLLCLMVPKWDFSVLVSRAHGIRAFMRCKPVKQKQLGMSSPLIHCLPFTRLSPSQSEGSAPSLFPSVE